MAGSDFLLQSWNNSGKPFYYSIGRKLAGGVYMIFPLDETDTDEATRIATCGKDRPEILCLITTYEQVLTLAHATSRQPGPESGAGCRYETGDPPYPTVPRHRELETRIFAPMTTHHHHAVIWIDHPGGTCFSFQSD